MTHIPHKIVKAWTQYWGTGKQAEFDIPFEVYDYIDLRVYLNDALQRSDYTIKTRASKNKLIFSQPPADGIRITIMRATALTRQTRFKAHQEFRAEAINLELDRLLAMIQDLHTELTRVVRAPLSKLNTSGICLPEHAPGKVLVWTGQDSLGNLGLPNIALAFITHDCNYVEDIGDGINRKFPLKRQSHMLLLKTNTQVFIDGVYQAKSTYNVVGNCIEFKSNTPPPEGSKVEIVYSVFAPILDADKSIPTHSV